MEWLSNNLATFWLIVGFGLLAVEVAVLGLGTGVLLFAGIGAILTGVLLWMGVVDVGFTWSIAAFVVLTTITTALLWLPFKRMQSGSELGDNRSSDFIGHEFLLAADITPLKPAVEHFSGVNWQVFPDIRENIDAIPKATRVRVQRIDAGIFHVVPV